uniref:cytochrome-b5 reductase n=1 Tax=Plectus sambesii TaxID=2011161 RepID=A0A914WVJ5_9BILA
MIFRGITDKAKTVTRQYTPISVGNGSIDLPIKLYSAGRLSYYLRNLKPGDFCDFRGPFGGYEYHANKHSHLLMFAAGTGIAPLVPLIDLVLANDLDNTFVRLIFCCRHVSDILLLDMFKRWRQHWNFSVLLCLSAKEEESTIPFGMKARHGKLDETLVQEEVVDIRRRSENFALFVCGTIPFEKDVINYARKMQPSVENVIRF